MVYVEWRDYRQKSLGHSRMPRRPRRGYRRVLRHPTWNGCRTYTVERVIETEQGVIAYLIRNWDEEEAQEPEGDDALLF